SELKQNHANIIGANCSIQSSDMIELCKLIRHKTDLPMSFQPNAGKPELVNGKALYSQTPSEFADDMIELVNVGANIIGGCCGTDPQFIQATHNVLKSRL
ncbi:MAG: homocysteine S-methyltransferase family protein, partial [Candidatus Hodarchaeota archaeon]